MLEAVEGRGREAQRLAELAEGLPDESRVVEADEEQLLRDIASSVVRLERGRQATIAELIGRRGVAAGEESLILAHHGIAVVSDRRGPRVPGDWTPDGLFLDPDIIERQLLRDTRWAGLNTRQFLLRMAGAEAARRRIGGRKAYGILIPWRTYVRVVLGENLEASDE